MVKKNYDNMDVVIAKGTKLRECTTEKTGISTRRHCANQSTVVTLTLLQYAICIARTNYVLLNVLYYVIYNKSKIHFFLNLKCGSINKVII